MSRTDHQDTQFEDLLDAITDALINEHEDVRQIVARYPALSARLDELADLIARLDATLCPQQPSPRFVRQLRRDLGGQQAGLLERLRHLPGRVQIVAAGLAVIAGGLMLVSRRRAFYIQETEIPLLQQR